MYVCVHTEIHLVYDMQGRDDYSILYTGKKTMAGYVTFPRASKWLLHETELKFFFLLIQC